jgi:hypothetical protein
MTKQLQSNSHSGALGDIDEHIIAYARFEALPVWKRALPCCRQLTCLLHSTSQQLDDLSTSGSPFPSESEWPA